MSTVPTPIRRPGGAGRVHPKLTAWIALLLAAIVVAVAVDRIFFQSTPAGTGSGVPATQARALAPFTAVELAGDNNVIVHAGAAPSVTVHADSNLLGRVTTRVHSGRLVIGTTSGKFSAKTPTFVSVSAPGIDTIALTGSGNINLTGINSARLTLLLSGSGTINATGITTSLDVTISGDGTALLNGLTARNVKARVSGDGSVMLAVTHSLDASISGTGAILYRGNPVNVVKAITGSGTISGG